MSTKISAPRWLANTAIISGLLAFICLVAIPFLPVKQVQSSLDWPQNGTLNSVNAPLISLAPESLNAEIPLSAAASLNDGQVNVLSTLPPDSPEAADRGLFVSAGKDAGLTVISINEVVFELTPDELAEVPADAKLKLEVTDSEMTIAIPGTDYTETVEEDMRPQVTGVYTEIKGDQAQRLIDEGLSAHIEINSRFTSSPTVLKWAAMILGTLLTILSLWCLWRLDQWDGKKIPAFRGEWRRFHPLDGIVLFVLGFWHIFGANTSDDGFLLTMARVANDSDYMANYYRWYGVPEAPFGSPFYDILSLFAKISTASVWMRIPTLIAGILIWWILSREILPRLGEAIATRRVAYWTAAFMFLAFWLPYNNGLRPEPIIALGLIATWASFERACATRRLTPAAVGTIMAAFTLACGPTGLSAVGVFLICLPALFRIMRERAPIAPGAAHVFPFLAAGTVVMVAVFHDQTLATVRESTAVRSAVGPALNWYAEFVRYSTLFEEAADGSLPRRFAMFTLIFCLVLVAWSISRYGEVIGAEKAPTRRMLLIFAAAAFFLMFTPTKWTHHFGIFAGIAGAAAALGAVVLAQLAVKSARARTFSLAAVMGLLAISLAGWNAWWYISSFNVPWWDKMVQYKGIEAATVMLGLCVITVIVGIIQSLRSDGDTPLPDTRVNRLMRAPIAVSCVGVVVFCMLVFVKSFVDQYPAYSVGLGNVRNFGGETCAMGGDVLVEANTNDSFLTPIDGIPLGKSLEIGQPEGFDPNGVPAFIIDDDENTAANIGRSRTTPDAAVADQQGGQQTADTEAEQSTSEAETQGNRTEDKVGVNGSTVRLPYNLDYNRVPVIGTFAVPAAGKSVAKTTWYELPEATDAAPLLVASVAGRIKHHDIDGIEQPGQVLKLEYGTREPDGSVHNIGEVEMLDPGPNMKWRNVRYPIADLPEDADVVRLVAQDSSWDQYEWLAITPLRNPQLQHLTERFDRDEPGLLDWSTSLQFPCNRPFNHYAGVAEIPTFRISPDAPGKKELSAFQDFLGGGAMSTAEAVNAAYELPGYLDKDWQRDWGSVNQYILRTNSLGENPDLATINYETVTRSGLWHPSDMKIRDPEEKKYD
ncbi:arabinosyltransferase domain-containing protein [Corynebacterium aquatimens]|uniref:Arabinosyltransferase C n=1 Tax=Corynebacterium aquatimens TaxID=1190508 RepID=A0A931DYT7_9CORY|nr:arabinosyltransferase domain-containing protein [Corynebacterium aquatimens]MBG6122600.1 arabinosyltransferase C [Corynebacterium aquatimens]